MANPSYIPQTRVIDPGTKGRAGFILLVLLCGAMLVLFGPLGGAARAQTPIPVETEDFGLDSFALGSLTKAEGALPRDLWVGANASDVGYLLGTLPTRLDHPIHTQAYQRLLLSPGSAPIGADNALTGKKLMLLAKVGFYREAADLATLVGNLDREPALAQAVAYGAMLDGDMVSACQRGETLQVGRNEPFWLKLRLLCYSAAGESAAADLTFGLLQDATRLGDADIQLFNSVITGQKPRKKIRPVDGFHYAAIRQLALPIKREMLSEAEGAVWTALAREQQAPPNIRAAAAVRMSSHNVIAPEELGRIFSSFDFKTEQLAGAQAARARDPQNPLLDAMVYQAAELAMGGSGFDRQTLVGETLRHTTNPYRFQILARLYHPMVEQFAVVQNYAPYADQFALVGLVSHDTALMDRWVSALVLDQTQPQANESAVQILRLLAFKDQEAATAMAARNGLPLLAAETVPAGGAFPTLPAGTASLPKLVDIAINAATASKGVDGLLALSAMGMDAAGELAEIRDVVVSNAMARSGLQALNQDLAFADLLKQTNAALRQRAINVSTPVGPTGEVVPTTPTEATIVAEPAREGPAMVVPRLKPGREG